MNVLEVSRESWHRVLTLWRSQFDQTKEQDSVGFLIEAAVR
jgi:hypothetical protein